jgi:hypothetical protein
MPVLPDLQPGIYDESQDELLPECEQISPDKIRIGKGLTGSRKPPALLK